MRCENKVSQTYYRDGEFIPRTIELRCGSTSIHGTTSSREPERIMTVG